MPASGVVSGQPAEGVEPGLAFTSACPPFDQPFRPLSVCLLKVALKLSAAALSARDPTALMLCRTPADLHPARGPAHHSARSFQLLAGPDETQ
jgi:hypothetical protein